MPVSDTVTIGFRNGFSGSVDRISWRWGRLGSDAPTRRATSGDPAPAAATVRSAVEARRASAGAAGARDPLGVKVARGRGDADAARLAAPALDRRDGRRRVDGDAR